MAELKACPEKIYLQACDECYEEAIQHFEAVTWCVDPLDHANLCAGDGHETVYYEAKDDFQSHL